MVESESAKFVVRVKPNSKQSQITGIKEGVLQVRVAAPPVEGKANEALIKFLSKQLTVSKSSVSIERGLTGKTKTIIISGMSQSQAEKRLETLI